MYSYRLVWGIPIEDVANLCFILELTNSHSQLHADLGHSQRYGYELSLQLNHCVIYAFRITRLENNRWPLK